MSVSGDPESPEVSSEAGNRLLRSAEDRSRLSGVTSRSNSIHGVQIKLALRECGSDSSQADVQRP